MAILKRVNFSPKNIESYCDRGIVYSLCAVIFVLPASIALIDSFAGMAVLLYFIKKINRMAIDWPLRARHLNLLGRMRFVFFGFAPPENPLNRALLLLTLAISISVLFSQYPMLSLKAYMGKYLKCLFLYFSFIEAFRDKRRIWMFLNCFMAAAFITVLSGIIQHYTGKDFLKGHLISSDRINSFFYTANGLGAYLLPVIGLAAHFLYTAIVKDKSWGLGGVLAVFLGLLLVCLCWTYSRSAWIGVLFIFFVMVIMDWRKILFAGVLLLVFIFAFLPALSNVRHLYLINDNNYEWRPQTVSPSPSVQSVLEQGGSGRVVYWKKAVSIIRTSPIWGTGLNTYTKCIKRDPNPKSWWYAHNCYLQMTAETGLLGLVCFLWVLFVLLRHGFRYCQELKDLWPLTILQGTVVGLSGFFGPKFFR